MAIPADVWNRLLSVRQIPKVGITAIPTSTAVSVNGGVSVDETRNFQAFVRSASQQTSQTGRKRLRQIGANALCA